MEIYPDCKVKTFEKKYCDDYDDYSVHASRALLCLAGLSLFFLLAAWPVSCKGMTYMDDRM